MGGQTCAMAHSRQEKSPCGRLVTVRYESNGALAHESQFAKQTRQHAKGCGKTLRIEFG
jgi:hypothetical protein